MCIWKYYQLHLILKKTKYHDLEQGVKGRYKECVFSGNRPYFVLDPHILVLGLFYLFKVY